VGAALARVHLAGDGYGGAGPSRFGVEELARRIVALKAADLEPDLARDAGELDALLAEFASPGAGHAAAGGGLIHGDLFRDNVLWKNGEITALLDFESASVGSRAFDLMVTVLAWCVGDTLDPTLCRALVDGYREVRELSPAERAELFREGCFAALRFTITRITDFELRPKGTGVYKDYRRFRSRLRKLEELGEPGLASVLGLAPGP
jgi:homoserine kinase type II